MDIYNYDVDLGEAGSSEGLYSGEASFLYSSKIRSGISVAGVCEVLASSAMFSFALDGCGRLYFNEGGRLRTQQLSIKTTIAEMGMKVSGYDAFMAASPGNINAFSFSTALNLLLSDKKLFSSAFNFPADSARIFMRPIAIRAEGQDEHELFFPYIRIYEGGVVSISMRAVSGFKDSTVQEVVENEVNKSRQNIISVLCEREFLLACTECQLSKMPLRDRTAERKAYEETIASTLNSPEDLELLDEHITVFELVSVDQLTLTDLARNLLSVVARAVMLGAVNTRISWLRPQYREHFFGEYWCGKPIIFIRSHTEQRESAVENWNVHKRFVDSVMIRAYQADSVKYPALGVVDLRPFDDYNNFYSESVSLLLSSARVGAFIDRCESYTFDNLTSDAQVLNEAAHFIWMYYSYASLDLGRCKTAINVARLELEVMSFEESTISAHKYGEIAKYIESVKCGEYMVMTSKLLHKKFESVRKAIELDEKIASESYSRRITIIFGIIASATLSPELMQPLSKYFGIASGDENLSKLYGIGASVVVVVSVLALTHYVFKFAAWVLKLARGR
ncbi:hypothetical protein [Pseudomonas sp.]|uniref:hypothetical protein n=1 Tax=Pseudomonas sp. TaxID=306 RepID=UPI0028ABC7CC|nr:hypothetical protein [Pseudomonas sp.]